MKKPVYCFIDDSPFELKLFKETFKSIFQEIHFICTDTYSECQRQLSEDNLYPSLFILDLYGRTGRQEDVCIPSKSHLKEQTDRIPRLDAIYDGLEEYKYDTNLQGNEFLKRLFSILNEWRNIFTEQCINLDQGNQFGIENLQSVRKDFPSVTAVVYTRKGLITDAISLSQYNYDGIFIKPAGKTDKDIYDETKKQAENLLNKWNKCIRNNYYLYTLKFNSKEKSANELAELLSHDNNQYATNKETKKRISIHLDLLKTKISTEVNSSTQEFHALALWTSSYYSL